MRKVLAILLLSTLSACAVEPAYAQDECTSYYEVIESGLVPKYSITNVHTGMTIEVAGLADENVVFLISEVGCVIGSGSVDNVVAALEAAKNMGLTVEIK